jgi:hypothetical protein
MSRERFQRLAVYYPETHETPGYQIVSTPDVIKTELVLQQNGYIPCPVHGGACAMTAPTCLSLHRNPKMNRARWNRLANVLTYRMLDPVVGCSGLEVGK